MNRKLQYVNQHQQCLISGYEREVESGRQELVKARVCLGNRERERGERGELAERTATARELKMVSL